jgi:D-serine deaminase-like pyridoxal phosphate-dependent protein
MATKAKKNNITFRPHFKTHQSAEIGGWFKESGISGIAVSSVQMASYFAKAGWNDILIAFPVNVLEVETINTLARNIKLHLLLESVESAKFLADHVKYQTGIYIKIDTGYFRTGIPYHEYGKIAKIIHILQDAYHLTFTGILTHAGHAYYASSVSEIHDIHNQSTGRLLEIKRRLNEVYSECQVSIGDTPTCSVATDFNSVDEIRPGNFIFYDVMQHYLGTCSTDQIAVAVACPIVARHKSRNEIVIYGGGIHLSKEFIHDKFNRKIFGLIVDIDSQGWTEPLKDAYVSNISQEHGIIRTTSKHFDRYTIGNSIGILPVHSCYTANLMSHYVTTGQKVISKFRFTS